jgi:hypothetical protein
VDVCASCGRTGVKLKQVTRRFGSDASLLVIEGILMWTCPYCAQSYFSARTMREIERIKTRRATLANVKPVAAAVAAFVGDVA